MPFLSPFIARVFMKKIIASLLCAVAANVAIADPIADAVANPERTTKARMRDEFRHPQQTLRFFDVQSDMAVVEIWPGWYADILVPLVGEKGKYYAAHFFIGEGAPDYRKRLRDQFEQKVKGNPKFKDVDITTFDLKSSHKIAPDNSVDRILTFRNIHSFYNAGGEETVISAFKQFHTALKTGGMLGIVTHRLPEKADSDKQGRMGYMKQSFVVKMAEKAGFKLVGTSEVNANQQDSGNHPKGVWTLPPRLILGDQDRAKYLEIGESDRMTIKFIKE